MKNKMSYCAHINAFKKSYEEIPDHDKLKPIIDMLIKLIVFSALIIKLIVLIVFIIKLFVLISMLIICLFICLLLRLLC